MNLVDLLDEDGLKQDEWSLTAPTFGEDNQLKVVGWSGRIKNGAKVYTLKCGVCESDAGLFGDGYFKSLKANLLKGKIPCGCAKVYQWSKNQYEVLCSRKASELGYVLLGFSGEWKSARTKLKLSCKDHGEWNSLSINHFLHTGVGCPSCKGGVQKPDELMVDSFLATGAFHPETKFWRSDRKTGIGTKPYWYMYCPICTETAESLSGGLQRGGYSCACSKHHQKEGYINLVMDGENCIAIKFGIANNSFQRLKSQNRRSVYQISNHLIYKFPNIDSCKSAEKECKDVLTCGVVSRTDVPDGHTETTYIYNLERVMEIYEKHGGVVCHSH